MSMSEAKLRALAMAQRLEFLATDLEKSGLKKEAEINREKAKKLRAFVK